MSLEIIKKTPVNMVEVKTELDKIRKRDEELNFRTEKLEDYLNRFVHLTPKQAKELYDKLMDLNIPRLKDMHIHKIIDILPKDVDDIKLILQGFVINVTKDNSLKIVNAVKDFLPAKK
jgi:DNA-directed RNA polymerase subunit F